MTTDQSQTTPRRRYRTVKARPGELKVAWGRAEGDGPDLCAAWQGPGAQKADSRLILNWLCFAPATNGRGLAAELEARGYDLTTLRFSVRQKVSEA